MPSSVPTQSTISTLYPGSKFSGYQKSGRSSYHVQVELLHVDLEQSFLCGYLKIKGLTDDWPHLCTFFEGEIIGDKHDFLTRKWQANESIDKQHWSSGILNELKSEYPAITFVTIDAKVQVRPIHVYPTLISYHEGKELQLVKGADKYQLLDMLENLRKESDFVSYWEDKASDCNIFGTWDPISTSIGTVELAVNK
ncbi:GID complex subunit 4, VID24 [Boothiomyces sp. JEL0866]|nr:GID complex subunit 4, VID24 [Boothiomyces sp. JEL0866]